MKETITKCDSCGRIKTTGLYEQPWFHEDNLSNHHFCCENCYNIFHFGHIDDIIKTNME